MKVKTEIFRDLTKDEVLRSIEKGAKEISEHLTNKKKLKDAKRIFE